MFFLRIKRYLIFLFLITIVMQIGISITSAKIIQKDDSLALNAASFNVLFSTFIGGKYTEEVNDLAVADDGSFYVIGTTPSENFPLLNAYDDEIQYYDAFITKFSADYTLLWSTFFGGSGYDSGRLIALASDGSCFVAGRTESSDLPMVNAYNDTYSDDNKGDCYVAKFSTSGSLLWSTYFGGNDYDFINCMETTADNNCFIAGATESMNLPMLNAYNDTYGGDSEGFIAKFSSSGSLLMSTFLGGNSYEDLEGMTITDSGEIYVTGYTMATDFPIQNAYDDTPNGMVDVFITKFSSDMELLWSTYFGGSDVEWGLGAASGSDGSCYITGQTKSINFPTMNAYDSSYNEEFDIFALKFSADGDLLWSTYIGDIFSEKPSGIDVTSDDSCYITGYTMSSHFPLIQSYDNKFVGQNEAFILKFSTSGTLFISSYLGGNDTEYGYGLAMGNDDSCYIGGLTSSATDFPLVNAYNSTMGGNGDGFIFKFKDNITKQVSTNYFSVIIIGLPIFAFIIRKKRRK